jgi:hypothetical protein
MVETALDETYTSDKNNISYLQKLEPATLSTSFRYKSANRTALNRSMVSGLNDYSKVTSKTTNVQLTQLAADILAIIS